jgi:hypothetical protein
MLGGVVAGFADLVGEALDHLMGVAVHWGFLGQQTEAEGLDGWDFIEVVVEAECVVDVAGYARASAVVSVLIDLRLGSVVLVHGVFHQRREFLAALTEVLYCVGVDAELRSGSREYVNREVGGTGGGQEATVGPHKRGEALGQAG